MRRTVLPLALATALLAVGCASSRNTGTTSSRGVTIERGVASWYGPGFHGNRTASGERYDMNAMTAAHPTLPFGTVVEVRNVATGQAARVRINDRGPFAKGRIIDLSRAAAKAVGVFGPGTAVVELVAVGRVPIGPRAFAVQVGAFRDSTRAQQLADELCPHYPDCEVRSDDVWHRVQLGSYPDRREADRAAAELSALGYAAVVVPLPLDLDAN